MRYILYLILLIPELTFAQSIGMQRRVMPSVGGGYSLPAVWSDNTNTKGLWYLEENTTSNRVNAQGTSGRDLAASASTARTTTAKQGTYSIDFSSSGTYLSCTDANCGGTSSLDLTGNFTIGCWSQPSSTSNLRRMISKGTSSTTANTLGYEMSRNASSALFCGVNGTSNTSSNVFRVDMWSHAVCKWDGTNLKGFINGNEVLTVAASNGTDRAENFRIGTRSSSDTANQRFQGYLDECFVINGTGLSAGQICRISKCGFDGEYCLCKDSPTTSYRSCVTDLDCRVKGQVTCSGSKCAGRPYSSCSTNADCDIYTQLATCNSKTNTCSGRIAGLCSGGSNNGQNCNGDADCAGGGSCTDCTAANCDDSGP